MHLLELLLFLLLIPSMLRRSTFFLSLVRLLYCEFELRQIVLDEGLFIQVVLIFGGLVLCVQTLHLFLKLDLFTSYSLRGEELIFLIASDLLSNFYNVDVHFIWNVILKLKLNCACVFFSKSTCNQDKLFPFQQQWTYQGLL
jgi:hypothetical protein